MVHRLILETTFLIDLEREQRRGGQGPAHAFLRARPGARLCVTLTTAGEVASGVTAEERDRWRRFIDRFEVLVIDLDVCWEYGRAFRYLHDNGLLIGTNDLWIAAAAIAYGLPLATRNARHFRRVPCLTVLTY